jgi:hypothetical protein
MIRKILILGALLAPLGCNEVAAPTDRLARLPSEGVAAGVSLVVEEESYVHLDTLDARLVNESSAAIGYNLCTSWRERRTGDTWERIDPLRMCTSELRTLGTGETATWREPVDPYWGTAEYRLSVSIWPEGADAATVVSSAPFSVSGDP